MQFGLVTENLPHNFIVSLRKQTASAIKNRSNLRLALTIIIQKSPITVMTVKITEQCIHYKHIPEMLSQKLRRYIPLLIYCVQYIFKLRTASVTVRIKDGVFD